jgi:hypothetical protein
MRTQRATINAPRNDSELRKFCQARQSAELRVRTQSFLRLEQPSDPANSWAGTPQTETSENEGGAR